MLKLDRQFGLYVIREPLALGSAKASCKAEDPFFDRDVVLKLVGPAEVAGLENLQRLVPFLDSVAGLEHPAISPIYDSGIEGDSCYYTTPFYAGGSLADQLTNPMSIGKSLRTILQLCSGLAYAYHEGFEQGKLSLKDIFFTEDGHAVITDFGVATAIKKLKHREHPHDDSHANSLRTETLQSIGEILIKLLLGAVAKPDAVSTALIGQAHSAPIASLAADLLGETEHEINDFDELIQRLTDLAVLGSEVGINEYVEYVEQTNNSSLGIHISGLKPPLTPSQRQLEIKEAVYERSEIRRLVAEKSKLQEVLTRAVAYKKQAEKKLAAGAAALVAAQQSEAQALSEAKRALDQALGKPNTRLHPAFWLAGGLLIGSLMTGGYAYLNSPEQEQLQAEAAPQQEPLTASPQPLQQMPPMELSPQKAPPVASSSTMATPSTSMVDEAVQQDQHLWWPAGSEFDTTAAVSLSAGVQKNVQGGVDRAAQPILAQGSALSPPPPDTPISSMSETAAGSQIDKLTQAEEERWWSAGNEFGSDSTRSETQMILDADCQDVLCVVENWAQAWSNKDLERYFSYYSEQYRPEPGRSREEWRSRRLARLTRPEWIKIMLDDFKVRSFGEDHIQVKLRQSYSSNYYQDEILKSLNLVKEHGKWRIVTERSLGTVNDMIGG